MVWWHRLPELQYSRRGNKLSYTYKSLPFEFYSSTPLLVDLQQESNHRSGQCGRQNNGQRRHVGARHFESWYVTERNLQLETMDCNRSSYWSRAFRGSLLIFMHLQLLTSTTSPQNRYSIWNSGTVQYSAPYHCTPCNPQAAHKYLSNVN